MSQRCGRRKKTGTCVGNERADLEHDQNGKISSRQTNSHVGQTIALYSETTLEIRIILIRYEKKRSAMINKPVSNRPVMTLKMRLG